MFVSWQSGVIIKDLQSSNFMKQRSTCIYLYIVIYHFVQIGKISKLAKLAFEETR
jgi:hypothetical protein